MIVYYGICGELDFISSRFKQECAPKGVQISIATNLQKAVRVTQAQCNRVEIAAKKRDVTTNHLLVELAMNALERHEWPRAEAKIALLRSTMFAAQTIAHDIIANGHADEVSRIQRAISAIVPEIPNAQK